jgi:SAM-dependent methyltransferase
MRWPAALSTWQKLTVLANSVRFMGPLTTAKKAIEYVVLDRPELDTSFDRAYGTDTAGSVQPLDLGIEDDGARRDAVQYLPSPASITRRLLRQLRIDPSTFSFVDFGCGKGRVLMVAAEHRFKRVVGVEISAALARIAVSNARLFAAKRPRRAAIEVLQQDASKVELPPGNTVYHFYHPFEPPLLKAVLANIERAMQSEPREIRIVYLAAFQHALDVLDATPWLTCERFVRCVDSKYSWAIYSGSSR